MSLAGNLGGFPKTPTETGRQQIRELTELVSGFADRVNKLIQKDIPKLNELLKANKFKTVKAPKIIELVP
jgi:hypothetical protein